jgi:signal transduction histidine kinase
MIALTFLASIMILTVTVLQYKEEAEDYHKKRLLRKESAVKSHIKSILDNTSFEVKTSKLKYIFKSNGNFRGLSSVSELSRIHNMPINIYDLDGKLIIRSLWNFNHKKQDTARILSPSILRAIENSPEKRFVVKHNSENGEYQSSYSYIYDKKFKPIAILNLPYLADSTFYKKELEEFLGNLATIYLVMFLLAILISFILSRYITKSLNTVNQMLQQTSFSRENQKIILKNPNDEINQLIESYNKMVDKLEESAKKLAQTEREEAWRNMARQVAHEIKNPLTPMRLNIQSFQMNFDPDDPQIKEKFNEFSNILIEQIDLMSKIASAFSDFAKMPQAQLIKADLVEVIQNALKLYDAKQVKFVSNKEKIFFNFDKSQMQRVIANLVKNAIQSVPTNREPDILVSIKEFNDKIIIAVSDNGSGIAPEHQTRIFEPKFTTKSSGMGLGLAIVKKIIENHNGIIYFETRQGEGTTFYIELKN